MLAVLPVPERRTRAAADTARALVAVGDVLPSRAGRIAEQMAGVPGPGVQRFGSHLAVPSELLKRTFVQALTRACDTIVVTKNTFCCPCREQLRASDQQTDTFAAVYRPIRQRSFPGMVTVRCSITREGVQCVRPRHCKGMCATHFNAWKHHAAKGTEKAWLRERAQPLTHGLPCQVPACPSPSYNSRAAHRPTA
ncbi:hypothetical protein [Streptomyces resistomycificus]|uniref:hypothetical protein n=1 Tax=Streptomyces resistomycificus TaxID=67356 RepID=UPI001ADED2E9|nr:hypothetical protein [Streptomyces resistomycificus]